MVILTQIRYATQSLRYYWRSNLALSLAVAAATTVLVGALVVGSSMRGSLKDLTLDRLAGIDDIVVGDHFFSQQLVEQVVASSVFAQHYQHASPLIIFPNGTSEAKHDEKVSRASNVNVMGVDPSIWKFQTTVDETVMAKILIDDQVVINRALAIELGIDDQSVHEGKAKVTLRIPKPTLMPNDSALGKKKDLVLSLVDMPVSAILENTQLGRFSMEPSQQLPRNIFLALPTLQASLARGNVSFDKSPNQINAIFLQGLRIDQPPAEQVSKQLLASLNPSPTDLGIDVKRVQLTFEAANEKKVVQEYLGLSTDRLVFSDLQAERISNAFPAADQVLTYLVNRLRKVDDADESQQIPYSMVSAIELGNTFHPLSALSGQPIAAIGDDEIVLNEWAANNLQAEVGDMLELKYFEPESTHGIQVESTSRLKLIDIATLTVPERPFSIRARMLIPAVFTQPPTAANDPDFTPEVPGLSDSDSIENWDLPFATTNRIRPVDDEYWNEYRTTPKGFVAMKTGQKMWGSRFGRVTGFRLPSEVDETSLRNQLVKMWHLEPSKFGLDVVAVKQSGLKAASGTTPFDFLFLGLSMFIIGAALMLVSTLFRLGIEQRSEQLGLLSAVGFPPTRMAGLWLGEVVGVCLVGGVLGVVLGIAYGALMIVALKTLWVGAIATPFLHLHCDATSLLTGFVCGFLVSVLTITMSIRRLVRKPTRQLLAGWSDSETVLPSRRSRWMGWFASGSVVGAMLLSIAATQLGGESQAGAFMGAGFLILASLLMFTHRALRIRRPAVGWRINGIIDLAMENMRRNPMRSTMIVGLVGVATFLIVAISSFRLQPSERSTGGAQWIAETSLPIISDLGNPTAQVELLGQENVLPKSLSVYSLRLKPGQDASCNNLFQSTQPRVLGIPDSWIERFDSTAQMGMLWAGSRPENDAERKNPWRMLARVGSQPDGTKDMPIPVVIDKNTAMYSLKIYSIGSDFSVAYDSGEQVTFRVVGFLENSLFQGSLLVGESDFKRAFPYISGYRQFLLASTDESADSPQVAAIEDRLGDQGFDVRRSADVLMQFASVQNTYLSAFQSLGGLGLLLGTFGLAAVQLRSIMERRKELALMQAIGFNRRRLLNLLFAEQIVLLVSGLGVGVIAALGATIPHWLFGNAKMPWVYLTGILLAVMVIGLVAALISARSVLRLPLAATLKS